MLGLPDRLVLTPIGPVDYAAVKPIIKVRLPKVEVVFHRPEAEVKEGVYGENRLYFL
jgi:hypothetical protein